MRPFKERDFRKSNGRTRQLVMQITVWRLPERESWIKQE
jgi:hypothetical protein